MLVEVGLMVDRCLDLLTNFARRGLENLGYERAGSGFPDVGPGEVEAVENLLELFFGRLA